MPQASRLLFCTLNFKIMNHPDIIYIPIVCNRQIKLLSLNVLSGFGTSDPNADDSPDLLSYVDQHIVRLLSAGHTGTARAYSTLARNLRKFLRGKPWPLPATNRQLIHAFHASLSRRCIKRNSLSAYMRPLKAILKRAHLEGIAPYDSRWFAGIYLGVDKTAKRALPREAMIAIQKLDLSTHPSLALSRDLFLFSFYARGMAFADIARLSKQNIRGNEIVYARRKTRQTLCIPLQPNIREIIDRYQSDRRQYLFPILKEDTQGCYDTALRMHNQRLKRIAALAGLDIPLSSYMARHSWATIARDIGIDLSVISAGMGHTNPRTTEIYLDSIDDRRLAEANRLVTNLD